MRTEAGSMALVVEDNRDWEGILREELLRAGFTFDSAWNREEALRKVEVPVLPKYDVVFLDPNLDDNLGGLSGRAIAERLAGYEPGTDLVLVSGYEAPEVLADQYGDLDLTLRGIFEKKTFDLPLFRRLLLDLRGLDDPGKAMFSCDREALSEAWRNAMAADSNAEKGHALEDFGVELLSGISLLKLADRRVRTETAEIDAVFRVTAAAGTLCQEWGGLLLLECRNRTEKFDAPAARDFGEKLRGADAKVGVVLSPAGISGTGASDARGVIAQVFQQTHQVIITLDQDDILGVLQRGVSLYDLLQRRDTDVRLGTRATVATNSAGSSAALSNTSAPSSRISRRHS